MKALQRLRQRYADGEARALYEVIMEQRFGLTRTDILLGKDTTLSADGKAELEIIIERVANGEPVQYVLGCEEFCGRTFLVGPGVLIPRPETQQLVELVRQHVPAGSTVLDVGTGSGCIAITLALDGYRVSAIDVSDDALRIARQNAERLGAEVEFVKEDVRTPRPPLGGESVPVGEESPPKGGRGVLAIVSNPPYVCQSEALGMDDNVLLHEPHLALFVPDDDPLLFYRAIADYGLRHLADGGWLLFETNRLYCHQVGELLRRRGYEDVEVGKDQFGADRFAMGRLRRVHSKEQQP